MLAARDESALKQVCADIRSEGGTVDYVVTDVSAEEDGAAAGR